jgi:hypothetical protein
MRRHWHLATLLTTILLVPNATMQAQHEEHAMSAGGTSKSERGSPNTLSPAVAGDVARLRTATAAFKSLDAAVAAGYEREVARCISHPQLGGMGYHHQNAALLDGKLEVERPEILVYRRGQNGAYELTGVEYEVPYAVAPRDSAPPTIMGQPLKHFDAIKMWYLHVWPWLDNPAGMFADWNPKVTCQ